MARTKGRTKGGTKRGGRVTEPSKGRVTPPASARYTPPVPKEMKISPMWVPVLMFSLLGLGMLVIILNYMGVLPTESGEASNWYLLLGLGLITGGFMTATRWR